MFGEYDFVVGADCGTYSAVLEDQEILVDHVMNYPRPFFKDGFSCWWHYW